MVNIQRELGGVTAGPDVLRFRVPQAALNRLNGLTFTEANEAWAQFVTGNRAGTLPMHSFDFVFGPALRRVGTKSALPFPEYNQLGVTLKLTT